MWRDGLVCFMGMSHCTSVLIPLRCLYHQLIPSYPRQDLTALVTHVRRTIAQWNYPTLLVRIVTPHSSTWYTCHFVDNSSVTSGGQVLPLTPLSDQKMLESFLHIMRSSRSSFINFTQQHGIPQGLYVFFAGAHPDPQESPKGIEPCDFRLKPIKIHN